MDAEALRILAAISSIVGSVLLAWRVRGMLSALSFVADMHEHNIQELASSQTNIVLAKGANEHVKKAKGNWLLVSGFILLGLSGGLNLWALFLK